MHLISHPCSHVTDQGCSGWWGVANRDRRRYLHTLLEHYRPPPGVATRPGAMVSDPPCFRYCWAAGCFGMEVREGLVEQSREEEEKGEEEARFWGAYMLILPSRSRLSFSHPNENHSVLGRCCSLSPKTTGAYVVFDGGFPKKAGELDDETVATTPCFAPARIPFPTWKR